MATTNVKKNTAVEEQYERSKQAASSNQNRVSQEDRLKRYFTTILPKGVTSLEKRVRILPTKDGSSPFVEVKFHEIQVDGKWVKLYDPAQEGKRSPLNEVASSLRMTGVDSDRELAKNYTSRKFYIVKVIDRDNEADGPKFWRFKHNAKGEGIFDKVFPIFRNKGDISDPVTGRDIILSLSLTKSGTGKEYTVINSIINEDVSPLSEDQTLIDSWVADELTWNDVYSKKPEDYLEMVAKGETPRWDNDKKGFVNASTTDEANIGTGKTTSTPVDPQADDEENQDLPF